MRPVLEKKRVAFHTLGCKLNFSETSTIGRMFLDEGYNKVEFGEETDVVVINTCSVTDKADKKCREAVKRATKKSPNAFVAVVGCYAQLKPKEISRIEGVDVVLGANEKFNVFNYISGKEKAQELTEKDVHSCDIETVETFVPSYSIGDRTRSFLKIQDGCDYSCTYCTIPLARGKSRNDSIAKTLVQAKEIATTDVKEIVITGVNTGDFGRSTNENFFGLVKELDQVEGVERFRISSIEPNLLSDEIIEFTSHSNRFVPHFHIPLQSGNNKILGLMKRRYQRELYSMRVEKIKELMPHTCIGVDVIVGFPGETEEDFKDTYTFLNELDVSYLHVFSYSERPNTEAVELPNKVPANEIARRSKMLQILSEKKRRHFYGQHLGSEWNVLFERKENEGTISGFTENYIKVEMPYDKALVNTTRRVRLLEINNRGNVNAEFSD